MKYKLRVDFSLQKRKEGVYIRWVVMVMMSLTVIGSFDGQLNWCLKSIRRPLQDERLKALSHKFLFSKVTGKFGQK